jgi:hypothetical protein
MLVEVHLTRSPYFPGKQNERMTYRSSSRYSNPDSVDGSRVLLFYIQGLPIGHCTEPTGQEPLEYNLGRSSTQCIREAASSGRQ